jgi:hypothetical protein
MKNGIIPKFPYVEIQKWRRYAGESFFCILKHLIGRPVLFEYSAVVRTTYFRIDR